MPRLFPMTAILVAATMLPANSAAQAPPDTFRLGEMFVTATRLPLPASAVPASVTVLRGAELRDAGVRFVADALRIVPGLAVVQSGSTGGITSVFLRGGESDHVRVMIDGVPINDPGGAVDLAHVLTADVERIEIVRGPTSVLYGSDAASGVIQIFTRRGGGEPRVTASIGAGSQSRVGAMADGASPSWDASATVTGRAPLFGYSVSASRVATNGAYAFNNEYDNTTVGGTLDIGGDISSARLVARWTDGTFHYPTNGAGAIVDANQYRRSESLILGLEATHRFGSLIAGNLSVTSRAGDYRIDDRPDSPADTVGSFAQLITDAVRRTAAEFWLDVDPTNAVTVSVGGAAEWQSARSQTTSESSFGPFESASDNDRRSTAVYAQAVMAAATGVTLTAGGRIDDNDRFGAFRTYRVGANWQTPSGLRMRVSAGTGFKEPTFFENFAAGFVTGNPVLQPERTRSIDAGVEQVLADGRLTLGAAAHATRIRNLIMFTFEPPAGETSNYFNVGKARAGGLELSARWTGRAGVTAGASWSWLDTEVTDQGFGTDRSFLEGRHLLRRPTHKAALDLGYAADRWQASVTADRTGTRDDLDFSDPAEFDGLRVTLDGVTTVDLGGGLRLLESQAADLDLLVRVSNLFDERYQEIINYPAAGRSVRIGLKGSF